MYKAGDKIGIPVEDCKEWPLVVENDTGLRKQRPGECFYCNQKIGQEHKRDCVRIDRLVKIRLSFEMTIQEAYCFDRDNIEFKYNGEGSHCSDNWAREVIKAFREYKKEKGCSCGFFKVEDVGVVDDTPIRDVTK